MQPSSYSVDMEAFSKFSRCLTKCDPSHVAFSYSSAEHRAKDITGLSGVIRRFLASVDMRSFVAKERYIFEKLNYKMAGPFRKHRFFRAMKAIRTALNRICNGDLWQKLTNFEQMVILTPKSDKLTVPSREMFESCLCSLLATLWQLSRIRRLSITCARDASQTLKHENFIPQNLILLATSATIWRESGLLLDKCGSFYDQIVTWRALLKTSEKAEKLSQFPNSVREFGLVDGHSFLVNCGTKGGKQDHFKFVADLLNIDPNTLMTGANSTAIGRWGAMGKTTSSTTDLGTAITRTALLKETAPQPSNSVSSLYQQLHSIRSLQQLKVFYKQIRTKIDEDSNSDHKPRTIEMELRRLIKLRWDAMIALKKNNQLNRLKSEIVQLKGELNACFDVSKRRVTVVTL